MHDQRRRQVNGAMSQSLDLSQDQNVAMANHDHHKRVTADMLMKLPALPGDKAADLKWVFENAGSFDFSFACRLNQMFAADHKNVTADLVKRLKNASADDDVVRTEFEELFQDYMDPTTDTFSLRDHVTRSQGEMHKFLGHA